jgi:signal peptidase II
MANDESTNDRSTDTQASVRRGERAIALCVGVALLLLALDLGSKAWAEEALSTARGGESPEVCSVDDHGLVRYQRLTGPPVSLVDDVLELQYAENCFAAFGLFHQAPVLARRVIFGLAALIAVALLMALFVRGSGGPYFAASVPLVIAGALGNFWGRASSGYVVDFLHFHYERPILWMHRFDYPNFNVADITIAIGVALMLFDGLRDGRAALRDGKPGPLSGDAPLPR